MGKDRKDATGNKNNKNGAAKLGAAVGTAGKFVLGAAGLVVLAVVTKTPSRIKEITKLMKGS
mgnify:CR=1 FL=1